MSEGVELKCRQVMDRNGVSAATVDGSVVDVVVPTRNRRRLVVGTVRSILDQERVRTRVIVVDDASDDGTEEEIRGLGERILYIRNEVPIEQRAARNLGASHATAAWLAFCDDDDLWVPSKLQKQLDAASRARSDWVLCSALHVDQDLTLIGGARLRSTRHLETRLRQANVVPGGGSGVILRRDLFQAVGGFDPSAKYYEDWDLWLRLARRSAAAIVDEPLVIRREWPASYSHSSIEEQLDVFDRFVSANSEGKPLRPSRAVAFAIKQRAGTEPRRTLVRELWKQISRCSPGDVLDLALTLGLPPSAQHYVRLRRFTRRQLRSTDSWLEAYR